MTMKQALERATQYAFSALSAALHLRLDTARLLQQTQGCNQFKKQLLFAMQHAYGFRSADESLAAML